MIIELVWSLLCAVGALLLATEVSLGSAGVWGVLLVFAGFALQAAYAAYGVGQWIGAVVVAVILVIGLVVMFLTRKNKQPYI